MVHNYKRYENESEDELILRVGSEKDLIGTWDDVAEILNELLGYDYGSSTYRKKVQTFQKMLEANKSKFIEQDAHLKEIDLKYEQLRKERIKLQTANVERVRIDRGESRQEMYYEYIGSIKDTIPTPTFRKLSSYDGNVEYLCCIADIHYGANFKSMNNEYSTDICKDRFELLLAELKGFIHRKGISQIKIANLGDTVQGCLRLSDLKINESSVVKATVEVSKLIAKFLSDLSEYCCVEYYHVPFANHSQTRPLGTKASEMADEDMEYVISHYIQDLCSDNERVIVNIAKEGNNYLDVHIIGSDVTSMHGHGLKNMESAIKDISMLRRRFVDYLILGHFHGSRELSANEGCCLDTEVLVCPSFIGSDPYSDSLMKGSKSAVKIFGFDELYGHTETYKFILN